MSKETDDYSQNISVFVRVRPTLPLEGSSRSVLDCVSDREITVKDNIKGRNHERITKTYGFNRVFGPKSSQVDVYQHVVAPLLDEVLGGYSCTVFAYGQTGTGKTFTMEGERSTDNNTSWGSDPNAGIIPRTLSELFERLRLSNAISYAVRVSFLELYNEELIDLLSANDDTTKLRLFEDATRKGAVIISGLEEVEVCSKGDVYKILEKGAIKRQTASTLMNAHSSRSHTVFTATVYIREDSSSEESQEVLRTGKINLVDLAGSENIGRSGAIDKRAREAGNINQSLLTLGRVITALVEHSPHIPYRESKLTRLLQESLGGRTKTSIIATVSPALCNIEETLSTLDYAHRAKNIQNKPEVNQRFNKKTLLTEYTGEIERLHKDLEASRQRSGVYLDQMEYDELLRTLDALDEEEEEKAEHIKALMEEHKKLSTLCNELNSKVEDVATVLDEKKRALESEQSCLSKLKSEVRKTRWEEREQTHLVAKHWETAEVLKSQASELRTTAEECAVKPLRLHDKLDRVRSVAKVNEDSGADLQRYILESTETATNLLKVSSEESLNKTLHIEALLQKRCENLRDKVETRINEVNSVCQDEKTLVKQTEEQTHESVTKEDLWCEELRDTIAKRVQTSVEQEDWLKTKLNTVLKKLNEQTLKLHLGIDDQIVEAVDMDVWRETIRQRFTKLAAEAFSLLTELKVPSLGNLSRHMEMANSVMSKLQNEQQEFYEKSLQKNSEILKLLAEMENLNTQWHGTYSEARTALDEISSNFYADAESIKSSVRLFLTEKNVELNQTKENNIQQISDASQNTCANILKWDTCDQLGDLPTSAHETLEKARLAWEDQAAETTRLVDKDHSARIEATQLLQDNVKKIQDKLEKEKDENSDKLSKIICEFQDMVTALESAISEYSTHTEVWSEPLIKSASEWNDRTSKFADNFQRYVPTGSTPQRTDIHYPRDLAATSPHEIILRRFRERRLETQDSTEHKGEESLIDGGNLQTISITDVALFDSSCVNKENSDVLLRENSSKTPEKKLKVRKPLSFQNARQ